VEALGATGMPRKSITAFVAEGVPEGEKAEGKKAE
jgi:hypothetical protein